MQATMPTDKQLRDAWSTTITPEDYEAHMANVGQAQANAALVAEFLEAHPPSRQASLLFAGAGTGQMFDYVSPEILLPYNVTFADINAGYLNRLRARVANTTALRYATVVDDLERTTLRRQFDAVLAVLVLEHMDWRPALATLCSLAARELFLILQQNPENLATPMTPTAQIPKTMQVFTRIHPQLIPRADLETEARQNKFTSCYARERVVADDKKMLALAFKRHTR
jgi:2-polyprenyl-3-methyl-5-hydroxy-6-metoxy-1,4-benzoquinol methylase